MSLVSFEAAQEREAKGLKDGGHIMLQCSACGEDLVDVWITKPDADKHSNLQAVCCYCGDKSFVKTITGGFHLGGVSVITNEDTGDWRAKTVISEMEDAGNKTVIKTIKSK